MSGKLNIIHTVWHHHCNNEYSERGSHLLIKKSTVKTELSSHQSMYSGTLSYLPIQLCVVTHKVTSHQRSIACEWIDQRQGKTFTALCAFKVNNRSLILLVLADLNTG